MPCPLAQGHPRYAPNPPSAGEYPQNRAKKPPPTSCSMPAARGRARQRRRHGQGRVKERRQSGSDVRGVLRERRCGSCPEPLPALPGLPHRRFPTANPRECRPLSDSSRLGKTGDVEVSLFRRLPQRTNPSLCGRLNKGSSSAKPGGRLNSSAPLKGNIT